MITQIISLLKDAQKGISPEVDRALGKHELPMTFAKFIKYIKRWLTK